jgi:hypothetical protein
LGFHQLCLSHSLDEHEEEDEQKADAKRDTRISLNQANHQSKTSFLIEALPETALESDDDEEVFFSRSE